MATTNRTENDITVDEVLALLKRTSLPTVVVEGADDMIIYRTFEEGLSHLGVSVLPVGGRQKVLEIFSRKGEVPASVRLIFIADQDVWVNIGIPLAFRDESLIFTNGYSIENDVYADGQLSKLLRDTECEKFESDLSAFVEWYALALDRHLRDSSHAISLHPDHVLNVAERPKLLELAPSELYPHDLRSLIQQNYHRLLRGKSLISLLLRNTNYKNREPHHTGKALLELVAVRPGPLLMDISRRIELCFTS